MNYTGFGQIGTPTAYAFGGGNIGGPNVWDFSSGRPQLSRLARQAGAVTLPAGALSRQEIRNRQDVQQAMMAGRPYVEMPTMYKLSQQGQYVDTLTGRTMGSIGINYSSGGWRNAEREEMAAGGGYSPNVQRFRAARGRSPYGPESGGYKESGGPQPAQKAASPTINQTGLSGTPFADRTEYPVLGGGVRVGGPLPTLAGSLTGFGRVPRFPVRAPDFLSGNY